MSHDLRTFSSQAESAARKTTIRTPARQGTDGPRGVLYRRPVGSSPLVTPPLGAPEMRFVLPRAALETMAQLS